MRSPTRNHVPVTLADISLDPNASIAQLQEPTCNGFVCGLEGSVLIGDQVLRAGEVGWLDRPTGRGNELLRSTAGETGARAVLYAGRIQPEAIVHYGPFFGDTNVDLVRSYRNYRAAHIGHISALR